MTEERPSERTIRERLGNVIDPCSEANGSDLDVVEMGLLRGIDVDAGAVTVDLRLTSPHCMMIPFFIERIEAEVGALAEVDEVDVEFDAGLEWTPDMITEEGRRKREHARSEAIGAKKPDDGVGSPERPQ